MKYKGVIISYKYHTLLLYGAKNCKTITIIIKSLQVFMNNLLRKILQIRWPQPTINNLLCQRINQILVDEEIRKRYWRWMGHTLWKPSNCTTRQTLNSNLRGERKKGRSNNTLHRKLVVDFQRVNANNIYPSVEWVAASNMIMIFTGNFISLI